MRADFGALKQRGRSQRSQALVEFSVVAPLFLLVIFGAHTSSPLIVPSGFLYLHPSTVGEELYF